MVAKCKGKISTKMFVKVKGGGSGLRLYWSINCQLFLTLVYFVSSRFIKLLEWSGVPVSLMKLLELSKPGISVKKIASSIWQRNLSEVAASMMKLFELLKPGVFS